MCILLNFQTSSELNVSSPTDATSASLTVFEEGFNIKRIGKKRLPVGLREIVTWGNIVVTLSNTVVLNLRVGYLLVDGVELCMFQ